VDEQKHQRNHQPDDRNGKHKACEDLLHRLKSDYSPRPSAVRRYL
jgi:hypothetical protein